MEPRIEKYLSDTQREFYNRGKTEGGARGEAKALLMILTRRGLALSDEQRNRIGACTDAATLDRWLERAFAVVSVDELFA